MKTCQLSNPILLVLAIFLFISNSSWAQMSSYYATNPSGGYGGNATITIDGNISDWSTSNLVAQGVANDDPRIFRGSHEGPVYDLYALYAAWDDNNLYLMWEYTNVTDVVDPAQGYPVSDNGKPYNGNLPIAIALDIDPTAETNGRIDGVGNSVWNNGNFINYANGTDHLLMMSTKPGVGEPALFKMNTNGHFDYDSTNVVGFAEAGITYQHGDDFLSPHIYGINATGNAGYVPSDLANETSYIDFTTTQHDPAQETFYEIKIPLSALGITRAELEADGIGAMVIATFGTSAIGTIPQDDAILDNAREPYTPDPSTSKEKEDLDIITAPMARIGAMEVVPTITNAILPYYQDSIEQGASFSFPQATVTFADSTTASRNLIWSPAVDRFSLGTSQYIGKIAGYTDSVTFSLTVTESTSSGGSNDVCSSDYFTWDNATIYFMLTDRFYNGDPSNDNAYGRQSDPIGGFNGGDIVGVTQKINEGYFDSLGVDAIWFTAPYEQVHGFADASGADANYPGFNRHYAYHGYYPLDWTEMDDAMGTAQEFKAFVDAAHEHGIRLVMDIVVNHVGYAWDQAEYNYGSSDPYGSGWCNWWTDQNGVSWIRAGNDNSDYCSAACGGDDQTLCLAFLPDIRTELNQDVGLPNILLNKWDFAKKTQEESELNNFFNRTNYTRSPSNYIIKWLTDWVREYGIDAFRIDTYKHVDYDVWGRLKDQAQVALDDWRAANPNLALSNDQFWMVGENFGAGYGRDNQAVVTGKTDAYLNFNFKTIASNPAGLDNHYTDYANSLNNDPDWTTVNYVSSHDVELFDRNDLYDAATSLLLAPGAAQIYYGDESGREYIVGGKNNGFVGTEYKDFNFRSFMNWGNMDTNLLEHWKKLGQFRKRHPAIGGGQHYKLSDTPYTFRRNYNKNGINDVVIVVIGAGSGTKTVNVSSAFADGTMVRNYYTKEVVTVSSGQATFNIGVEGLILIEEAACQQSVAVNISTSPSGTNFPDGSATVTLTPSPSDATVIYTIDGGTWQNYSAPFGISGQDGDTREVCAVAIAQGDSSTQTCRTYTFSPSNIITIRAKNDGCSTPYLYVFDVNGMGGELTSWPGFEMTADPDNPGWYMYSFEANNAQVVLNCNSTTNKTADLYVDSDQCWDGAFEQSTTQWPACPTPVSITGLTLNNTHDTISSGSSYTLPLGTVSYSDGTTSQELLNWSPSLNTIPLGTTQYVGSINGYSGTVNFNLTITEATSNNITIRAQNTGCGTPHIHIFERNGVASDVATTWPGNAMTPDPNNAGWYLYTIQNVDNAKIVLNCGSSANQTDDLYIDSDRCWDGTFEKFTTKWTNCPAPQPITALSIPQMRDTIMSGSSYSLPMGTVTYADGTTDQVALNWSPTLDINTIGTTQYTGTTTGYAGTVTFDLTVIENTTNTITVRARNIGCTTPHIHIFERNGNANDVATQWPGNAMIPDTNNAGWYIYTIPNVNNTKVVLNCGGTANQTDDLYLDSDKCWDGTFEKFTTKWTTCPSPVTITGLTLANTVDTITSGTSYTLPMATASYSDGSTGAVSLNWSPALDNITLGTTQYTGTIEGYAGSVTFDLTVTAASSNSITIRARNTGCTTPYIHVFDRNGVAGDVATTWPGDQMTTDPNHTDWYIYTIDNVDNATIVLNCGGSTHQTDNLYVDSDKCWDGTFEQSTTKWTTCPNSNSITNLTIANNTDTIVQGNTFSFPLGTVTYSDNSTAQVALNWTPTLDNNTVGTTVYTGSTTGYTGTVSFSLTVLEDTTPPDTSTTNTGECNSEYFDWDAATVYFLLTDRFMNGNPSNDNAYGRVKDPVGGFLGGDFQGIQQKISEGYFDSLGVNALWITAPYEQIHGSVPGYWCNEGYPCATNQDAHYGYHGYYPLDWTETDDAYGSGLEFQAMIDSAHAHGIRIVMDIVINHVGYETPTDAQEFNFGVQWDPYNGNSGANFYDASWKNWWTDQNDISWIRKGEDDFDYVAPICENQGDLNGCLAGLPDIRTDMTTDVGLPNILLTKWDATKESQEMNELNTFFANSGYPRSPANHIIKWLTDWVREYGVDAFRIDTYKHVETPVWGRLKDQAQIALDDWRATNPHKALDNTPFWTVGELFGAGIGRNDDAIFNGKTDALINFDFQTASHDINSLDNIYANYANNFSQPDWTAMSYLSSHDKDLYNRNNLWDGGTALMLCPGPIQIFYGDETRRQPSSVGTDQASRSFMNWGSIDQNLLNHWRKLGQFRKRHPAIGAGQHTKLSDAPYTFSRFYNKNGVADGVIVALGVNQGLHTVDVSSIFSDGQMVRNFYTKETTTVNNGLATFDVGADGIVLIESADCAAPVLVTISTENNRRNFPTGVGTINLTASPSNASIYYTIDGGTPQSYSAAFDIAGTPGVTRTVCTYAVHNGDTSSVECNNYTFNAANIITIKATNTGCNTAPYIHIFTRNGLEGDIATEWPGIQMVADSNNTGWYTYSFEADNAEIVLNCGSNVQQTDDLYVDQDMCWDGTFEKFITPRWTTCPVPPTIVGVTIPQSLDTILVGDVIDFPLGTVTYSDNTVSQVALTWSPTAIDNTAVGTTTYTGTLADYADSVDYTVTVIDNTSTIVDCPMTRSDSSYTESLYSAIESVYSTAVIDNTQSVTLKAGQCVELQPGFEVKLNGQLEVIMEACDNTTNSANGGN